MSSPRHPSDLNVIHAAQLAQVRDEGGPRRGRDQDDLDLIADGAVAIRNGRVVGVGTTTEVLADFGESGIETIDASGKTVLPGLVDCHSHPLFSGQRHEEYRRRLGGASLAEIARQGGGIWASVVDTRASESNTLMTLLVSAYERILRGGVTTLEVKSGYGLTLEHELQHLELLHASRSTTSLDLVISFLGAHVVPRDSPGSDHYVAAVLDDMLPAVVEQGIASFHDLTCESGLFSPEQATVMLNRSRELGVLTRVHADAWMPSQGWRTAVAGGAVSADHLTYTPTSEIDEVGTTDTVAVLLPSAELIYMCDQRANARRLMDLDVPVAIATDYCSSIHATSLVRTIALASPWFGITPGAAIIGATLNAAYSLGLGHDRGSIATDRRGDLTILDCIHPNELCLALGDVSVSAVVIEGEVVVRQGDLANPWKAQTTSTRASSPPR